MQSNQSNKLKPAFIKSIHSGYQINQQMNSEIDAAAHFRNSVDCRNGIDWMRGLFDLFCELLLVFPLFITEFGFRSGWIFARQAKLQNSVNFIVIIAVAEWNECHKFNLMPEKLEFNLISKIHPEEIN